MSLIKFKLNKNPLIAKKLDIFESLSETRINLGEKMPLDSVFVFSDGTEIEKNDENKFHLNEIVSEIDKNLVVFINLKESTNNKTKTSKEEEKVNKPIMSPDEENSNFKEELYEIEEEPEWLEESNSSQISNST